MDPCILGVTKTRRSARSSGAERFTAEWWHIDAVWSATSYTAAVMGDTPSSATCAARNGIDIAISPK
jgi:hypothetical protein